ncbi:hypothetical protein GCM10027048_23840 [Hymenobacter coalescens]
MENAIRSLRIRNFKSIKDVTLQPRRVNLLIGQPNVGKSNVLEALSLLGTGLYDRSNRFMDEVIRYETVSNLFYDNDTSVPVIVESADLQAVLGADIIGQYQFLQFSNVLHSAALAQQEAEQSNRGVSSTAWGALSLRPMLRRLAPEFQEHEAAFSFCDMPLQPDGRSAGSTTSLYSNVSALPKKYVYRVGQPHNQLYRYSFLAPPSGYNLWEVVQFHPALRKYVAALFKPYGQKLVLRVGERKFEIQKEEEDLVYNYPYSLIADTLQRIIFYTAAIESNKNSVLLFEEPEAHSYPGYVAGLARRMVDSETNQFFVATHSPYLFTEVVEQMLPYEDKIGELGIFVAYYEDHQTKIHQLTDEQMLSIRSDSVDVFLNMRRFIPRPADA